MTTEVLQPIILEPSESIHSPIRPGVTTALGKILDSPEFSGSAQLARFLRYVVENTLSGQTTALKESVIGTAVFNRGSAYDPKVDPIVRVEARRLRSRLATYYAGSGGNDDVRISLPKGGYVAAFEFTDAPAEPVDPVPLTAAAEIREERGFRWAGLLALGVAAMALVSLGIYKAGESDRLVAAFWTGLLEADRPALLIPADSALVVLQNLAHRSISLQEYITGEYRARLSAHGAFDPVTMSSLGERRYTSIADLEFAIRLGHRAEAVRRGILTRYARDARVEDMKGNNLILLGARQSNPWVELFEKDATFRLEHDPMTGFARIVNLAPQPGEPTVIVPAEAQKEVYGIVTYHPNRDGSGIVVVVAGTSVAGTEAAADLLLDDSRLLPWLKRVWNGKQINGFDMLLRSRNLAGSAPRAEVVAFHPQR